VDVHAIGSDDYDEWTGISHYSNGTDMVWGRNDNDDVENAEDAALVRAEGIGYLQGYHLGPPTIERTWLGTAPSKAAAMDQASSRTLGSKSPALKPGSSSRRVSAR